MQTMHDVKQIESTYSAATHNPLPVVLTKGEGIYVWDQQGKRYLDMGSAVSVVSLGHQHPRLMKALIEQASLITVTSRLFFNDKLGLFLKKACEITRQDKAIPMNSGVEAVETAIKAVRKWGYLHKNIPEDKAEIIVCDGNFHGRTVTTISLSSEHKYKHNFGPLTTGFKIISYNDTNALQSAINPHTAAFLVEPIQGEAGVKMPDFGYLKQCEEICKKNKILLICDEIQTGMGRTGKILACDNEQVKPDGILLGKALGGGILPVSLFLGNNELMDVFKPGDHGSTFGGNPLAAAVGLETLNLLTEEKLAEQAALNGDYLFKKLCEIQSPLIKEIRGKGLLIGIEVNAGRISSRQLCLEFLEQGLLAIESRCSTIRLMPPLIISKAQIDEAVDLIQKALRALESKVCVLEQMQNK